MKKEILIGCIGLLALSCNENLETSQEIPLNTGDQHQAVIGPSAPPSGPLPYFQAYVDSLYALDWIHDTARANKVYRSVNSQNMEMVNGKPYYKIDVAKHMDRMWGWEEQDPDAIMKKVGFDPPTNIWTYFYREREAGMMIADGLIEQWEFADAEDAEKVYAHLNDIRPMPYFNTSPYYAISKNHVFVFNARASLFSHLQKPLFELFTAHYLEK